MMQSLYTELKVGDVFTLKYHPTNWEKLKYWFLRKEMPENKDYIVVEVNGDLAEYVEIEDINVPN